ncbi:MAG: L,D-transpeptidase [Thiomonas sp.]|nr:L,D-transpeptidase [Thiomonas sp.]
MKRAIRRSPLRKLLPWALLCVPLVFAARAATDYNATPNGLSRLQEDRVARPKSLAAEEGGASAPPAAVSARTLLKLTTSLSRHPDQDGAERRLLHAYAEVAAGHLDAARAQAEQLVRDHPHFSLAQLLLGDVMQASRGDTAGFAAAPAPSSPQELAPQNARILELRAEALARLGAGKTQVGDIKTPLGIYFVTLKIGTKDLKPLYGAGALTLIYPNEWDKQQGHTGFGVWLHGAPPNSDTRVPLASDGCVVLSNPDVRSLMADTPAGGTPVVITRHVQWLDAPQWAAQRQRITAQLQADITRSATQGLRPQDVLAAASAAHAPAQTTPVNPGALTILQYPGQIVVQYSAADSQGNAGPPQVSLTPTGGGLGHPLPTSPTPWGR